MKNCPVRRELFRADRRTDRHDEDTRSLFTILRSPPKKSKSEIDVP